MYFVVNVVNVGNGAVVHEFYTIHYTLFDFAVNALSGVGAPKQCDIMTLMMVNINDANDDGPHMMQIMILFF